MVGKNLYNQDAPRTPVAYGVLDRQMGTNTKDATCTTCNKGLADCIGHFGYINLELPVFHIGYFRSVIMILQTICKVILFFMQVVFKQFIENMKHYKNFLF